MRLPKEQQPKFQLPLYNAGTQPPVSSLKLCMEGWGFSHKFSEIQCPVFTVSLLPPTPPPASRFLLLRNSLEGSFSPALQPVPSFLKQRSPA